MMRKGFVDGLEAAKQQFRQLEDVEEINEFLYSTIHNLNKFFCKLSDIKEYNTHREDESFKNKIEDIKRDVDQKGVELVGLVEAKIKELDKGLSPERIQQFLQFEADESHVGDQCQVCLEEVEVGRLMKQLDCGGRHSFCSVCIDQWFANHKTCPICRHVFV